MKLLPTTSRITFTLQPSAQGKKLAQLVENDNMDQSHENMGDLELGVCKMSEHFVPNMLQLPDVKDEIGKV